MRLFLFLYVSLLIIGFSILAYNSELFLKQKHVIVQTSFCIFFFQKKKNPAF